MLFVVITDFTSTCLFVFTFNRLVFPIFTLSPPSFTFRLADVIHSFISGSRPIDGGDSTSVIELSSIKSSAAAATCR